jgi:lipopolysaccharide/colanic/teichoic acid biosynthesis glycosyltransferase
MGKGGEVLLLDMGEQVRIVDLARQLIRLSGLREGEDIEIVFTGLRPGEKIYEELHSDGERTRITRHERILMWDLDAREETRLLAEVAELEHVARTGDAAAVRRKLQQIVPEYSEPRHAPLSSTPAPSPQPVIELPAASVAPAPEPAPEWPELVAYARDAAGAGMLLALSSPVWLAAWLEARVRRERSPLVHETRVGRTRRRRSRRGERGTTPIDRRTTERRLQDILGQPIRCARFRSDLGPVGRWITRRRLDKIPFLLNVLRGEMALVGPKPEKEELVLRWQGLVPDYARRFSVLPGVTGLAQVSECADSDAEGVVRRVHYDLFYIDNRSLLLDVRTLGRTLGVLARRPRKNGNGNAVSTPNGSMVKGVTR